MDTISWPAFALGAALALAKAIDLLIDRLRERRKETSANQREDRKTVYERLDKLETKYDDLREKYDTAVDQRDEAERERDNLKRLYSRMANAVQWLILDNELMCRKLGINPSHKYRDLTGETLNGGINPND